MTRAQRGMERDFRGRSSEGCAATHLGGKRITPQTDGGEGSTQGKSVKPIRTGPDSTMRRKALIVRSLAPKPANRGSNLVKF